MSAGARSLRARAKKRRPLVSLALRVPAHIVHWLRLMTTAERDHIITMAVKKAVKEGT